MGFKSFIKAEAPKFLIKIGVKKIEGGINWDIIVKLLSFINELLREYRAKGLDFRRECYGILV